MRFRGAGVPSGSYAFTGDTVNLAVGAGGCVESALRSGQKRPNILFLRFKPDFRFPIRINAINLTIWRAAKEDVASILCTSGEVPINKALSGRR